MTRTLTLNAGVSFSNAHLIGPQPAVTNVTAQLQDGDRLGGVPKWTANAAASYVRPVTDGLLFRTRIDYSYLSSRANIVSSRSPSYFRIDDAELTNLTLALEREDTWTASLRVNNLWNDFVPLSGKVADGNLIRTVTAARPRAPEPQSGMAFPLRIARARRMSAVACPSVNRSWTGRSTCSASTLRP